MLNHISSLPSLSSQWNQRGHLNLAASIGYNSWDGHLSQVVLVELEDQDSEDVFVGRHL